MAYGGEGLEAQGSLVLCILIKFLSNNILVKLFVFMNVLFSKNGSLFLDSYSDYIGPV
jgi:hypothetical protein